MGSDRRHLSGKALAKIFEEISTGPSFVPLRGPHHVSKPPPIPQPSQDEVERENGFGASPRPTLDHDQARTRSYGKTSVTLKVPTSSSSRPPPPHPILKKSRGPSTSGKRPTARFVSPHESEDEAVNDVDTSSGSTNDSALRIQLRPAPHAGGKTEKRSTPTGRKHVHVASTSASRRRPALPRRQSSQSSGVSDGSTKGSTAKSSPGLRPGSIESRGPASRTEPDAMTEVNSPVLSSKAAGKQPMRTNPEKENPSTRCEVRTKDAPIQPVITPPHTAVHRTSPERLGNGSIASFESSRLRYEVSREPPATNMSSSMTTQRQHLGATLMVRSQSNIETPQLRPRETGSFSRSSRPHGLLSPADKATPSGVTISNVVAQVQFDSASVTPLAAIAEPRDIPDSVTLPSRGSSASLFSPTQPSTSPGIHLGRSKSQLTLLLERGKDRIGDGHRKGKGQRT
ncbi:hypothetical protein DL546_005333 [Coniochaeta pulveracea]|nr:hypothetical protein DL546_005333 [Coniochaeta pulveracea]